MLARSLLLPFCYLVLSLAAPAASLEFKPNDVVALIGGEDIVVAAETGHLELLITKAFPEHRLKFRSLAWEGDTVFEQRRDVNYPTLPDQLEKIGATVVIAQFGQMESLSGEEGLPNFTARAEKLLTGLAAGGTRRIAVLTPTGFETNVWLPDLQKQNHWHKDAMKRFIAAREEVQKRNHVLEKYVAALEAITQRNGWLMAHPELGFADERSGVTRDGVHLTFASHREAADEYATQLAPAQFVVRHRSWPRGQQIPIDRLAKLIEAKNRLWFHYYRPQNWAFLAGDRTNQPSSRDHLNPSKRWFPEELEAFIPLIEKLETEIHELAAELGKEERP